MVPQHGEAGAQGQEARAQGAKLGDPQGNQSISQSANQSASQSISQSVCIVYCDEYIRNEKEFFGAGDLSLKTVPGIEIETKPSTDSEFTRHIHTHTHALRTSRTIARHYRLRAGIFSLQQIGISDLGPESRSSPGVLPAGSVSNSLTLCLRRRLERGDCTLTKFVSAG